MPRIKTVGPYEFRFYSRGEASEQVHIHVRRGRLEAKFWLEPTVRLARAGRFKLHELNDIVRMVEKNQQEFREAWREYFQ